MADQVRFMPRWTVPFVWTVGIVAIYGIAPWALSLIGARAGWTDGSPGAWNLIGLAITGAAFLVLLWCISLHFAGYGREVPMQSAPQFLLQRGPYRVSRNPLYIADSLIVFGWAIFYGSLAVLIGGIAFAALLACVVVPSEERKLTEAFGEDYLRYKAAIPRWIGRVRT